MKEYDCVVIGSGPGGYVAAIRAAQLGLATACVEKSALGGTCLNTGCIPTKTMLAASDLLGEIRDAKHMGLAIGDSGLDMKTLNAHKRRVVKTLQAGIAGLLKKNKVDSINGLARVTDRHQVEVSSEDGSAETVKAANIIVATGSTPSRPAAFPFGDRVMTSDEILALDRLPASILIVGGGIIGAEFACFFNDAGSEVTIVEMLDRLVSVLDEDISGELTRVFKRRKMTVHLATRIESLDVSETGVTAHMGDGKTAGADIALIAIGRTLAGRDIGLEEVGVDIAENGVIQTDDYLRTAIGNIYAVGDVNGRWQLAHPASHQGIIAAENIAGRQRRWSDRVVPSCLYTRPEIASLGLTEAQAKERYDDAVSFRYPIRSLGRAIASGATDGFVKLVAAGNHREIVGIHIMGARATDLIAQGVLAMDLRATAREFVNAVHPHPTFSEAVMECAAALLGEGIHS